MSTAVHLDAEDTSNYIKHTHANPIQRRLIDRFHKVVLQKIEDLTRSRFSMPVAARVRGRSDHGAGARCPVDRFRFQPLVGRIGTETEPDVHLRGGQHFRDSVRLAGVRCHRLLRGARASDRPGRSAPRDGAGHLARAGAERPARAVLLPGQRGAGQEPRHPAARKRSRPQAVLDSQSIRRVRDNDLPGLPIHWLGGSLPWTICIATRK